MNIEMPMQTETGEIIATLPELGFTIIRTLGRKPEEFFAHYSDYVIRDEREIQKGLLVRFETNRKSPGNGRRPRALLVEIIRAAALKGVA